MEELIMVGPFEELFRFHDVSVSRVTGSTFATCELCGGRLEGNILVEIPSDCCPSQVCDGCITTLSIKIATIRRRQAGIPPVGH